MLGRLRNVIDARQLYVDDGKRVLGIGQPNVPSLLPEGLFRKKSYTFDRNIVKSLAQTPKLARNQRLQA